MSLNTDPNFHEPGRRTPYAYEPGDDFYEALIGMHEGLDDDQSTEVNACLILLLANHIGDLDTLKEAMALARQSVLGSPG